MQVDAFILIGGRSSRLGYDKAFVQFGGTTLAQRAVNTIRDALAPARTTMVAGNSLQFATRSIAIDVPFIFDLYENRGPLGGLHAALANASTPWIFLLACDYPFVPSDFIRQLAGEISSEDGAVVPEQADGRLQPLCAFYRVDAALPVVEGVLGRPRSTPPMHEVLGQMNPRRLPFANYADRSDAERIFMNVNTPGDLTAAIEIVNASKNTDS